MVGANRSFFAARVLQENLIMLFSKYLKNLTNGILTERSFMSVASKDHVVDKTLKERNIKKYSSVKDIFLYVLNNKFSISTKAT